MLFENATAKTDKENISPDRGIYISFLFISPLNAIVIAAIKEPAPADATRRLNPFAPVFNTSTASTGKSVI